MTYETESQKIRSKKAVLVTIEPTKRLQVWTVHSGSIYYKDVDYYVVSVKEGSTSLTSVASVGSVIAGTYFFDETTKRLYVRTSGSVDPSTLFLTVKFKLFFSNYPCILPHDLDTGFEVEFDSRLNSIGSITQEVDTQELFGISLEGRSTISFINNDGFFDEIYDTLIWENALVSIYSWFPNTPITESKVLFFGYVKSKKYSSDTVTFSSGDFISKLNDFVKNGEFSESDGTLDDSMLGKPKPRIYGRVEGKKLIGTDKILDGFTGQGTITGSIDTDELSGVGTFFLTECSPGDKIKLTVGLDEYDYDIKEIGSDTYMILSSNLDSNFSASTYRIEPGTGYYGKNRTWYIAGHKLREPSPLVVSIIDLNRYELNSTEDLFINDLIEINNTLFRIKRVFGNSITLYSSVQTTVNIGDTFRKSPINTLQYIGNNGVYSLVEGRDFTVTNTTTDCYITLENEAEFNVIAPKKIAAAVTFVNGDVDVTSTTNLLPFIKTRDYIQSDSITHTTYYEVLSIAEDGLSLVLRDTYAGTNVTTTSLSYKNMDVIHDDTTVFANCYGYENGSGEWIKTASDAVKHLLLNDTDLVTLNTASFIEADTVSDQIISYSIPFDSTSFVKIRDAINAINKSVFGNLYSSSEYLPSYSIFEANKGDDTQRLETDDIYSFSVDSKSEIINTVRANYRHFETDSTGESGSTSISIESDFVNNLTGIQKEEEFDIYLYDDTNADTIARRFGFIYSLSQSVVSVQSDLRLSIKSLNDKMWINLDRLYKRFGQQSSQKIGIITKKTIDEDGVDVSFSDLGNILNRVCSIADSSTAEFTSATEREKMLAGFIVDDSIHLPDTSSDIETSTNLIG